jgi:hypothetical protein
MILLPANLAPRWMRRYSILRLDRPSRASVMVFVVLYMLACGYYEQRDGGSDRLSDFSLKCAVAPWTCVQPKEVNVIPPPPRYNLTRIYFGGGHGPKSLCSCHFDRHEHKYGDEFINHIDDFEEEKWPCEGSGFPLIAAFDGRIISAQIGIISIQLVPEEVKSGDYLQIHCYKPEATRERNSHWHFEKQ